MSKTLSKKSKLKLCRSVIRPIVTYASETWLFTKQMEEKLVICERKIMRMNYGPTVNLNGLRRKRTNEEINILLKQRNIVRCVKSRDLHGWDNRKECMRREQQRK
jgi:hypothetical protein